MFLFLLQRTHMNEAAKRGHMNTVHYLREDGISDVNVVDYNCTLKNTDLSMS